MMQSIRLRAPAKINLYLDITGKRPDGYHELETVMQSVSLYDYVNIALTEGDDITVSCTDEGIPAGSGNICYKAAENFFGYTGKHCGAAVHIEKNIPSQAGMGGGSADAAAVIYGLDRLMGTSLDEAAMTDIGAKTGADVPFCISGGTRYCTGIGEVTEKLADMPLCDIVIAKGISSISTAEAYARADSTGGLARHGIKGLFDGGDIITIAKGCMNIFESVTDIGEIGDIKQTMLDNNALCSCMTGSGSAVFGIFDDHDSAVRCADIFRSRGIFAEIVHPCGGVTML